MKTNENNYHTHNWVGWHSLLCIRASINRNKVLEKEDGGGRLGYEMRLFWGHLISTRSHKHMRAHAHAHAHTHTHTHTHKQTLRHKYVFHTLSSGCLSELAGEKWFVLGAVRSTKFSIRCLVSKCNTSICIPVWCTMYVTDIFNQIAITNTLYYYSYL